MSEIEQRGIIHYYYLKGKMPAQIHQKLVNVYQCNALKPKTVEYWYHEFKCGRVTIDDKPRSGRPPLDDLDAIILKTLTEYPFSSVSQISDVCGCSYGTAYNRLTEVLGYKNYTLRWVPYSLTNDLKNKRVNGALELKSILVSESQKDFINLITGDQSWFFLSYEPAKKWSISKDDVPFRVSKSICTEKVMITVMFSKNRIFHIDMMKKGQSFNTEYFINNVLEPTIDEFRKTSKKKKLKLHLDNCRVHNSKKSNEWYNKNGVVRVPHPLYSPDLAPSDYFLFGYLKEKLAGLSFTSPEELFDAITEILHEIPSDIMNKVFESWIKRCDEIINNNGEYIK